MFTDIHCHLLPAIDDGASSLDESLAMARMAVDDGIGTVTVTPHQLGAFRNNTGSLIRQRTEQMQRDLDHERIPLRILPGADVRIDETMMKGLLSGEVVTLGDQGKHVLLELPHELYFSLEPVLKELERLRIVGILSHPERNEGILRNPRIVSRLVEVGCLMQVTAGSITGTFGPLCQQVSESMLTQGLVHFVATDAHGSRRRRPRMRSAFDRVTVLAGSDAAQKICCDFPAAVARGDDVPPGLVSTRKQSRRWFSMRATA